MKLLPHVCQSSDDVSLFFCFGFRHNWRTTASVHIHGTNLLSEVKTHGKFLWHFVKTIYYARNLSVVCNGLLALPCLAVSLLHSPPLLKELETFCFEGWFSSLLLTVNYYAYKYFKLMPCTAFSLFYFLYKAQYIKN